MYNAYLATRQKARKQREDSATAGMAETPSGGAKSSEELKAMGDVGSIRMRPR